MNWMLRKFYEGMLTASGIGAVVMKNATVAGAEGGCQAECGVAAAMAGAAAVHMCGGTSDMCANACGFALMMLWDWFVILWQGWYSFLCHEKRLPGCKCFDQRRYGTKRSTMPDPSG